MAPKLKYVIVYIADMGAAVKFYRDTLGFSLRYETPHWSEFSTGETTLALHPASAANQAGKVEAGLAVEDLTRFHAELTSKGVRFPMEPRKQEYGGTLAQMQDPDGTVWSVSGP